MFFSKLRKILYGIVLFFFGSTILAVFMYKYVPVPYTPLMAIRTMEHLWDGKPSRTLHHWVPLDSITDNMPIAVMSSEDQLFLQHNGFDVKAIIQAQQEAMAGGRKRGASTISQQTAKNVFLWPGHSWIRKGFEVYFTFLIEKIWGKDRIMEVYLNSIEMGDGIYGVDAVAQENFNRRAWTLTRAQCALIAATLPNPIKFDSKYPSRYMYKRERQIIRQMRNVGPWWRERHEGGNTDNDQ